MGLVHGLAGRGALIAIVFAQIPSAAARIGYVVVFGIGAVVGMAAASALVGASLRSLHRGDRWLRFGAGTTSHVRGAVGDAQLIERGQRDPSRASQRPSGRRRGTLRILRNCACGGEFVQTARPAGH